MSVSAAFRMVVSNPQKRLSDEAVTAIARLLISQKDDFQSSPVLIEQIHAAMTSDDAILRVAA